jgi:hypothetical protein
MQREPSREGEQNKQLLAKAYQGWGIQWMQSDVESRGGISKMN